MSMRTNNKNEDMGRIRNEILLAYLLPSYQTMTSKWIRAQENYISLMLYLHRKENVYIRIQLMTMIANDIAELKESLIKKEKEFEKQMQNLAQIDMRKFELINKIYKQLLKRSEDIDEIIKRIDALFNRLNFTIEKIDRHIQILQTENTNTYRQLESILKSKFRQTEEGDIYNVRVDDNNHISINTNDINTEILNERLNKVMNRETNLYVDIDAMVESNVLRQFQKTIPSSIATHEFNEFMKNNSVIITNIKQKIRDDIRKSNLSQQVEDHIVKLKNNNETIKFLVQKMNSVKEQQERLMKDQYEFNIIKNESLHDNELQLSNIPIDDLNQSFLKISGDIEKISQTNSELNKISLNLDNIDTFNLNNISSFIANIELHSEPFILDTPDIQAKQSATSSYGKMMSALNISTETIKKNNTDNVSSSTHVVNQVTENTNSTTHNINNDNKDEILDENTPRPGIR